MKISDHLKDAVSDDRHNPLIAIIHLEQKLFKGNPIFASIVYSEQRQVMGLTLGES